MSQTVPAAAAEMMERTSGLSPSCSNKIALKLVNVNTVLTWKVQATFTQRCENPYTPSPVIVTCKRLFVTLELFL